ncbi:MAG: TetR/AcrR family transcriptional regulator [Pseudomonadota bacterium]
MSANPQEHERNRNNAEYRAFVDAAIKVFVREGFGGTTFEHLSRATGIEKMDLSKRFGSIESIFRLVYDDQTAKATEPYRQSMPEFDSAIEATRYFAARQREAINGTQLPNLFRIVVTEKQRHPEIADILTTPNWQEGGQAIAEYILQTMIDRGLFNPCNVRFAAREFFGSINQALVHEPAATGQPIADLDEYIEHICQSFASRYSD